MTPLAIITGYLLLLLLLGGVAGRLFRGTSQDYMLASHTIGPFLLLMSLFGTTMTAFALVGSTGEAYKVGIGVYGLMASSSGIVHSLCFFLIGVRLWSFGRKNGYTTQIQFFRDRLDSDRIGILLFPILVGLVIPYLLIGVMASGTVINRASAGTFETAFAAYGHGVPPWLASAAICGVVLIYVFFGGMRGTAWANTFQTLVFMILGVVTFYVIATKLGGQDSFLENLKAAGGSVSEDKLTRVDISKTKFLTYMLVPLSVGMFPHVFQHWLTAKSAESFKLPIVAQPVFIMIVWAPCVLVGVWATTDLASLPPEVSPNGVLPFLVKAKTGDVLAGLLSAGILAAIMSSLDSQFLSIGSMFTNDIVLHYAGKDRFTDKQIVLIARLFVIGIVAVTYILSLLGNPSVFALGIWCFSGFAGLFPLVLSSVYWRRLTKAGAYGSILTTAVSWAVLFYLSDFAADRGFTVNIPLGGQTHELMPVAVIVLCSTVSLVAVSLVTSPPGQATIDKFFQSKAESK